MVLLIANLILAVQVTMKGGAFVDAWGFRAGNPSVVTAFTSIFLHWNVFHLLGNLLFIVVAGAAVEIALGWWRYLIVYTLGGLAGALVHWAAFRSVPDSGVLIGASASVASCIGYSAIRYAGQRVPVSGTIHVPIFGVIAVWVALQILGVFVKLGDSSGGTGYAAHLGGLALGLLMAFVFGATSTAELDEAHERLRSVESLGPDASMAAAMAILEKRPDDPVALAQAADAAQVLGEQTTEIGLRLRQLRVNASPAISRLVALGALKQIPALERMKLAETSDTETKKLILRSVADEPGTEQPHAILELIALDPSGGWKERLSRDFALHPAMDIARSRGHF